MHLLFFLGISSLHLIAITAQLPSEEAQPVDRLLSEKYDVAENERKNYYDYVLKAVPYCTGRYLMQVAQKNSLNFAISPLGNFLNYYMAYYGAGGETEEYFEVNLLLNNETKNKVGLQALVDDLATYKGDGLSVANSLFHSPKVELLANYVEVIKQSFRSPVQEVDFMHANEANNIVSGWCEGQTANLMKNVVPSEDHALRARALTIANTVHFKGEWLHPFQRENTKNRPFRSEDYVDEEKLVPTMTMQGNFMHGKSLRMSNATFVKLPFKMNDASHKIDMYIVLPELQDGLKGFEQQFESDFSIEELIKLGKLENVYIELPKFTISNNIDLKGAITRDVDSGQQKLFQEKKANFRGISENVLLHFSEITQNSIFRIDEEGCETASAMGCNEAKEFAAVTRAATDDSSFNVRSISFLANHAFYAVIVVEKESSPLYVSIARFTG